MTDAEAPPASLLDMPREILRQTFVRVLDNSTPGDVVNCMLAHSTLRDAKPPLASFLAARFGKTYCGWVPAPESSSDNVPDTWGPSFDASRFAFNMQMVNLPDSECEKLLEDIQLAKGLSANAASVQIDDHYAADRLRSRYTLRRFHLEEDRNDIIDYIVLTLERALYAYTDGQMEEREAREEALGNSDKADGALSNDDNLCGDEVEDVEEADDSLSHKKDCYEDDSNDDERQEKNILKTAERFRDDMVAAGATHVHCLSIHGDALGAVPPESRREDVVSEL
ncbi:hypothetical protein HKX48_004736 [Thoreauomyces humboldtii]|nr:hypothetical protein HKX48_004736 [Thoreauomyces humboldtii]